MFPTASECFLQYQPSLIAAAAVTVMFAATTAIHVAQILRSRTFYFIPFVAGGVCEVIGYIGRSIVAAEYPNCSKVPYILNTILPLMAPALFAASMYTLLGHTVQKTTGEDIVIVRTFWRTKLFVFGDLLSGIIQAIGGAILMKASAISDMKRAEMFIAIGLVIQLVFFCLFLIVSTHFDIKLRHNLTEASWMVDWKSCLGIIYFSGGLIIIRTIFRLIENLQGNGGELQSSEVYLYLFDAALMLAVLIVFNFKHPSSLFAERQRLGSDNAEATESSTFLLQERRAK